MGSRNYGASNASTATPPVGRRDTLSSMQAPRTALITGASSGIGRAMAKWWAGRGTTVIAAARRMERLEALAQECEGIVPVAIDVSNTAQTVATIEALDDAHGGLDLVIANAGVGDPTPGDTAAWAEVERVLQVNVMGAAATLTAILPRMVKRDRGQIVGVSSIASRVGLGAYSCYSGSKAFLAMFLSSIRVDLHGTNVRVTCIEPGFVRSEMSDRIEGHAPMPFRAETEDAADVFCRAILRGARTVSYPRIHAVATRALAWVPAPLLEPIARRASEPQRRMLQLEAKAAAEKSE